MYSNIIYRSLPVFFQNVYISVINLIKLFLREDKLAKETEQQLNRNEKDEAQLSDYCVKRLNASLNNAVNNVNYYKGKNTIITSFDFIDKNTVREDPSSFYNHNYVGVKFNGATSGTTGSPLVIPQSAESVKRERAFANRQRRWAGFEQGDKRAWIRGDMIVPLEQKKAPFWRYSYFENMIMLSSFHMAQQNLQSYIEAMQNYKVNVIQAYPSSIVTLAKYLESNEQYYLGNLKSIITSSESLSKEDKNLIEKRFRCTVFDWYGLFERVAAIASCEHGRYHILTDYAHVELLPAGKTEDGRDRAEIIGTNFNNSLYPLIRYKTGDHVVLSDEPNCSCGRVYPIVEAIEGRVGDYLLAEDGQKVHILNHIPKGVEGLIATQFIQDKKNEITILVVTDKEKFDQKQISILIANAKSRLGMSITFDVKKVEKLPRTNNGKIRQAICSL
ncbi:phenylacetate--CoA ligase family protein [Pseudoalteromonas tetraodonis]|uniref:phenylacetate--CoA ligase family protein n=1 Tax=Pseudoalteromonas tetraodonis TaxID=43659 RepID=UPI001BDE3EBC|nr:phenylacetate--CoA ligase family protein [Pseudoalteromonas tetraodonis]MBT2153192.1 phenylacetate--CoA ligase family protein [Pseudoalteromonas tetraodonis]